MMLRCLFLVALLASSVGALEDYVEGKVAKRVLKLTNDNFKTAIKDPANPIMFIMFGAYWCGHCKRLGPILDTAAPQVAGRMAIAKIDCTEEKKLCEKYKIRGYPTLKFSLDGEVFDYTLGRTEEDIVGFADQLSRPTVKLLNSVHEAMKYSAEETNEHGVSFLCHDPNAPKGSIEQMTEGSKILQVCSQVARKQMAHAHFTAVKSDADVSTITDEPHVPATAEGEEKTSKTGFVCRLEKDVLPRCLMEKEEVIDTETLLDFVKEQNVALVTPLGPQNFHRIGRNGRPLVIGVADINDEEQVDKVKAVLAKFGKKGPKKFTDKYYLGWMDGVKWAKFLEQFKIKKDEMPQFFVLDVPARKYWYDADYQDKPLKEMLIAIADGDIEPRESGGVRGAQYLTKLANVFFNWMPWSLFLLLGIGAAVVVLVVPDGKDLRPPFKKGQGAGQSQTDPLLGKKHS